MREEQVKELLTKYSEGNANAEEMALVEAWYEQFETSDRIIDEVRLQSIEDEIFERLPKGRRIYQFRSWAHLVAAASIVLILSAGGYLAFHKQQVEQTAKNQVHDIAPGGNKAILTLSNGQQISLTDAKKGTIAKEGPVLINKTSSGQVVYSAANSTSTEAPYNTITTPRGGKYSLILPDGTLVMLDAASSITYRTSFTGNSREVSITGQVYFEVTHNPAKPFRVSTKDQTVEVLGTHFNINAYEDEPEVRTTLLEGSVRVSSHGQAGLLKPGQQSIIRAIGNSIVIKDADLDEVTAWKEGDFIFNNDDLASIMRQLSRWYNIDVSYRDDVRSLRFGGLVSRSRNISAVLSLMESTGKIHFKIEGRRVMVIEGK